MRDLYRWSRVSWSAPQDVCAKTRSRLSAFVHLSFRCRMSYQRICVCVLLIVWYTKILRHVSTNSHMLPFEWVCMFVVAETLSVWWAGWGVGARWLWNSAVPAFITSPFCHTPDAELPVRLFTGSATQWVGAFPADVWCSILWSWSVHICASLHAFVVYVTVYNRPFSHSSYMWQFIMDPSVIRRICDSL